jgi:NADPH-ferrihemoprotein reductase
LHDLENYDVKQLSKEQLVVLVVATYGEGDPTDNAAAFHDWIMSQDRQSNELANVQFSVSEVLEIFEL